MIGLLFSIGIGLYIYFNPLKESALVNTEVITVTMIVISSLILLTQIALSVFAWTPLEKRERTQSPGLISLYSQDRALKISNALLFVFLLFTFLVVVDFDVLKNFSKTTLLIAWVISLGVAIDLVAFTFKRIQSYLNPLFTVTRRLNAGEKAIQDESKSDILNSIDMLSETALKATKNHSLSLAGQAIDALYEMTKIFIHAATSVGHHLDESKQDTIGYTLFYIYQRLDMIFQQALKQDIEPIMNQALSLFGKIALEASSIDLSLASFPLSALGRLALQAEKKGFVEVSNRSEMIFVEVARSILQDRDITYLELEEPFKALVNGLKELAREHFRQDKKISVQLLLIPLEKVKSFLNVGKANEHQDKEKIVQMINQALDEFKALQEILSALPGTIQPQESSSHASQDG